VNNTDTAIEGVNEVHSTAALIDGSGHSIAIDAINPTDIRLYGWTLTEDTQGRPYETYAPVLHLTSEQAAELARRLLNAAAGCRD
jgi:hypothetical protein